MTKKPTIVVDFNQGISNNVAILPVQVAIIAMNWYRQNLQTATGYDIVSRFKDKISNTLRNPEPEILVSALSEAQQFVETNQFNEMISIAAEDFREFDVEKPVEIDI